MKLIKLLLLAFCLAIGIAAGTQNGKTKAAGGPQPKPAAPSAKDCSCTGTGCKCTCTGKCCTCGCDGGNCICQCIKLTTVSLTAGTTINAAAEAISAASNQQVVVLSGGDELLSSDIKTTPWQALARLSLLPRVRLGVVVPDVQDTMHAVAGVRPHRTDAKNEVKEIQQLPGTEVVSLCVHEEAGLPAALETLSRITGYAFEVSGSPAPNFTLTATGTVDEILVQLSSAAGITVTLAR